MSLNDNKNNYSIDDNNKSIKYNDNVVELFNKDGSKQFSKTLALDDLDKNININSNSIMNNSKKRKSTHSSINCIDVDQNKITSRIDSNQLTEENLLKDSNIVSSLKNKIKDLNNELNKLRNDSNVQNYNILEMNYKLKNKEINALKQENNFFRFNLEERKRNLGQKFKKGKTQDNKNKYIINSIKKYKHRNLLKPMKEQDNNESIDNEEENEKDDKEIKKVDSKEEGHEKKTSNLNGPSELEEDDGNKEKTIEKENNSNNKLLIINQDKKNDSSSILNMPDLSVNKDDPLHWKGLVYGPEDSPYQKGKFEILINFEENKPEEKPHIQFKTKIYHYNINQNDGEVLCPFIWNKNSSEKENFENLKLLMSAPDSRYPCSKFIQEEYYNNFPKYKEKAMKFTEDYAMN